MPRIEKTITIGLPPEEVWRLAGDPGSIGEWMPVLSGASYEGDERSCTTADGGSIVERVLEHSDEERFYTYEIVEAPLPVRGYRSTLSVDGHGDHSHVTWVADFEVTDPAAEAEITATFEEMYQQGLEGLRDQLASKA